MTNINNFFAVYIGWLWGWAYGPVFERSRNKAYNYNRRWGNCHYLHCFICLLHCCIWHLAKKIQQQQNTIRPAMQSDYFFFRTLGIRLWHHFIHRKNLVVLSTIKISFKLWRSIFNWVGSYTKKFNPGFWPYFTLLLCTLQ